MSLPDRFGRFEILDLLGEGAMGVVYLARDTFIGRKVALKTIQADDGLMPEELEELQKRFEVEIRSAGSLHHPNIVTLYDAGKEGDTTFIAMEYVHGESLDSVIESGRQMSYKEIGDFAVKVCGALDYAHDSGVVHRDVKPANILLDRSGDPKITDFGVAKLATVSITQAGTILGSPSYMSPEQITGRSVTGASDQFSVAVILYELLTGERPFSGESLTTIMYKIVHESPAPVRSVNKALPGKIDPTIMRALEKDSADRYPSCMKLATALCSALGVAPGRAGRPHADGTLVGGPGAPTRPGEPADEANDDVETADTEPPAEADEPARPGEPAARGDAEIAEAAETPEARDTAEVAPDAPDATAEDDEASTGALAETFIKPPVEGPAAANPPADVPPTEDPSDEASPSGAPATDGPTSDEPTSPPRREEPQPMADRAPPAGSRPEALADPGSPPWRWIAAGIAAAALVGLGWFLVGGGPTSDPTGEGAAGTADAAGADASAPSVRWNLRVNGRPAGSEIWIDGENTGMTAPADVGIPRREGERVRLELRVDGETVAATEMVLGNFMPGSWPLSEADGTTTSSETMSAIPGTFTAELVSEPPGARVVLDGRTLEETTPLTLDLDTGERHSLQVERDGYQTSSWSFRYADLSADQKASGRLFFPLVRVDGAVTDAISSSRGEGEAQRFAATGRGGEGTGGSSPGDRAGTGSAPESEGRTAPPQGDAAPEGAGDGSRKSPAEEAGEGVDAPDGDAESTGGGDSAALKIEEIEPAEESSEETATPEDGSGAGESESGGDAGAAAESRVGEDPSDPAASEPPAPDSPAPRTADQITEPIRVTGEVEPPEVIESVIPEYPREAVEHRIRGVVILEITVDREGRVADVRVLRGLMESLGFNDAAVEAIRQWRFRPARLDGEPVPVVLTRTIRFKPPD